ncbi:MAG: preprotein translocase subunit SecG [Pseudomonadales bacterium]|jgi:preprotein translocase subunit SecG|nr:preprotein translocase subunit SecG [Pseudomonadales bacterium]MCP5338086.1 preprotein translocase subunit SecG [Pseudomonadales bacterium]
MEQLILVVYLLLAVAMTGLILLQQGRGADAGASFGSGASQTVFGSAGSGNVLTRATAILATLFFVASVGLAVMAKHKAEAARDAQIPVPVVTESRQVQELPGDLPQQATNEVPSAGSEVPAAPAPAQPEIPAQGAGNPAPQDVPSAPAP